MRNEVHLEHPHEFLHLNGFGMISIFNPPCEPAVVAALSLKSSHIEAD